MRLSAHQVLITLSVALLCGILFGSVYTIAQPWLYSAMAFACIWLGARLYNPQSEQESARVWMVRMCMPWVIVGFCLGCLRIQHTLNEFNQYAAVLGTKIDLEGVVMSEPDIRSNYQLVTIQPTGFTQNLLVTMPLSSQYEYGDQVWIRGKAVAPKLFDDFDYPGYLARFNIFALVRYPKMIVLRQGQGNWLVGTLFTLKHAVVTRTLYLYGQEQGRLLLGILIGAKQGLPQNIVEYFSRTGTSHIMAVSGFNISILLIAFGYVSYVIGRRMSSMLAVVVVILFVFIAGPTSSVLRAAGMGMLIVLATTGKRLYMPLGALAFVAALMALLNPRIVYWDVGFQLSTAATVGILVGMPLFEQWIATRYKILEPLAVTLTAIVFTVPISLWRFGTFSTVALLTNAVVVPTVPVVMALGALSLLPVLGSGFAFLCSLFLSFILLFVAFCAHPAWASIQMSISGVWVVVWYVVLAVVMYLVRWRSIH